MTLFLCPCSSEMSIIESLGIIILCQNLIVILLGYALHVVPKWFKDTIPLEAEYMPLTGVYD